ncbi:MAG TPA: hypothetical protein VMW41_04200 [Candidatus Bathyarchaeia archaeon]|nr:hypothetical protein [Candidatus Bathyarchaeia archaeon]
MDKLTKNIPIYFSLFCIFSLNLSFLVIPSQNQSIVQADFNPYSVRNIDFSIPDPARYPIKIGILDEPVLTASGAAVLDRRSGVFLYQKNPDQSLSPASIVKIMTATVALETYSPLEVIMVPKVSDEGQDMKLVEGELITVEALLYGLLVSSANDAAQVLARNYSGGEAKFIEKMNDKTEEIGLKNTFFTNPTGLDNGIPGFAGSSKSSARDLAWLADYALKNEIFAKIVATKKVILKDPQNRFVHPLTNLNELLWTVPGVKGVKTGWTEIAGECLVTYFDQDQRQLITVILGSKDRFGESKRLLDWINADFKWEDLNPETISKRITLGYIGQ